MGGDQGPRSCVNACLKLNSSLPAVQLTLFGDRHQVAPFLPATLPHHIQFRHTSAVITMADKPAAALRHKRDSSMALAVAEVAEGRAQACVSSGNTGALMAFGMHFLRLHDGIERPPICKAMPALDGCCYLLDIGANVRCSAENLLQYARLGTAFANSSGITRPRVGLLNVGKEAQKGAQLQRQAAELLEAAADLNYVGFVEGGDIYRGGVDVVVCDGFSGNVLLKASEGAAEFMRSSLRRAFSQNMITRLSAFFAYPLLSAWQSRFNPDRYNGAVFLGLDGVVVKSHGAAGELGVLNALHVAHSHAVGH